MATQIATWFVADAPEEGTFFPQVGAASHLAEVQAVYWRCVAVFFASSLAVNAGARHVFYTNTQVPVVDGVDLAVLLARWEVEVVPLPVGFRLPQGSVTRWGNQFYVFDVMRRFVAEARDERLMLLDSDCVWRSSVAPMAEAIDREGALTLPLGFDEHPEGEAINGLSRGGMARFAARHGGHELATIPYCGGEIVAATRACTARIVEQAERLWPALVAGEPDAPREEAHLLSVIYALEGVALGAASPYIRRMWTTFRHNTLLSADRGLAIWHLPAEKRTGFAELFARIVAAPPEADPRRDRAALGFDPAGIERAMGFPRRRPAKFARDLAAKLREKLA